MSWIPKYGRLVRRAIAAGGGSPEPQGKQSETSAADETSAVEQPAETETSTEVAPEYATGGMVELSAGELPVQLDSIEEVLPSVGTGEASAAAQVEITVQGADVTNEGVALGPETVEVVAASDPLPPEPSAEPIIHPLDHDGNGIKGGSLPKSKRKPKSTKAE